MELSFSSNTSFPATASPERQNQTFSSHRGRSIVPTTQYCMPSKRILSPSLLHLSSPRCIMYGVPSDQGLNNWGRTITTISDNTRHPKQRITIIRASNTETGSTRSQPVVKEFAKFKYAIWTIIRPYAIRGLLIWPISFLARDVIATPSLLTWSLLIKTFLGLIALSVNIGFIGGINQLYDVGIDKINKPYLPIAAGRLSVNYVWMLLILFTTVGVLIVGMTRDPLIIAPYLGSALISGIAYSVPPLRWKRFSAGTLFSISMCGLLLQFCGYYATRVTMGLTFEWSYPLAFHTIFTSVFQLCITIFKDLPDVEGDNKFQISTWAIKYGVRNMAFVGFIVLLLNYIGAVLTATCAPQAFQRSIMIPACTIKALSLVFQAWKLEKENYTQESLSKFYLFIWTLYDAELILFPFMYK